MKYARLFVLCVAAGCAAIGGGCDDDEEEPFRAIGAGDTRLSFKLDPFELRIVDAKGRVILRSLPGAGDTPYGAPSATRDDGVDGTKLLPGWDAFVPTEGVW